MLSIQTQTTRHTIKQNPVNIDNINWLTGDPMIVVIKHKL